MRFRPIPSTSRGCTDLLLHFQPLLAKGKNPTIHREAAMSASSQRIPSKDPFLPTSLAEVLETFGGHMESSTLGVWGSCFEGFSWQEQPIPKPRQPPADTCLPTSLPALPKHAPASPTCILLTCIICTCIAVIIHTNQGAHGMGGGLASMPVPRYGTAPVFQWVPSPAFPRG